MSNRDLRPAETLEPRLMLFGDTVVEFGESLTVIHEYADQGTPESSSHFLANTGDENYFAWLDQNPATPNVADIYYDFRPVGSYANVITAAQMVSAETALAGWEQASEGNIAFTRNTTASADEIINIGVGDFAAFGYTSEPAGLLGLGGGTVTHGQQHTITAGIAWLDSAETWDVTFGNEDPPGTFDAFTVFAHEIGHALGLGHTDDLPQSDIMDGGYVGEKTEFSANDSTLVQVLYGNAVDIVPPAGNPVEDSDEVLAPDQVYNDDLIVNGSAAVGFDAVNGENFSFDTLRLKENNLRIHFDDTSNSSSFPDNDWRIRINDTTNGGDSYFAIEDSSGGQTPFRVDAGADNNSFFIESTGQVGFGTNNPVVELHSADGDTPTLRLEQNGSYGWSPQTWDIAGNETNFFIRDVTNASKLPFRIRPNAPTNSLLVDGNGEVAMGVASPDATLHVKRTDGTALFLVEETGRTADQIPDEMLELRNNDEVGFRFNNTDTGLVWNFETFDSSFRVNRSGSGRQEMLIGDDGRVRFNIVSGSATFDLSPTGDLTLAGTLTQGSSREIKEDIELVDSQLVLGQLVNLPVAQWNYIADENDVRHVGPMAEDFYATFGLGEDAQHIAPGDLASVVIAGAQGLYEIVAQRADQISVLSSLIGVESSLPQQATEDAATIVDWLSDLFGTYEASVAASSAAADGGASSETANAAADAPAETIVETVADPLYALVAVESAGGDGLPAGREYVLVEVPADFQGDVAQAGAAAVLAGLSAAGATGSVETVAIGGSSVVEQSQQVLAGDTVIADDVIVRGSAAIGVDAINGENFGSDTLRLKENNLRLTFIDTSNSASFPKRDWQLRANDSNNGGDSFLSIDDLGDSAGNGSFVVGSPFRVEAGAPTHSVYVDAQGDVGFGTDNPVLELHTADGDTPTLRLEQNGTSGWSPQTWDVAGNETNFFVRDVSNGSKLPFRIRPNAPTNSIYIANDGDVGLGTASPAQSLHVRRSDGTGGLLIEETGNTADGIPDTLLELRNNDDVGLRLNSTGTGLAWNLETFDDSLRLNRSGSGRQEALWGDDGQVRFNITSGTPTFDLATNGDLTIAGTLSAPSSVDLKENLENLDSREVLDQLAGLGISEWNYVSSENDVRHVGPMAEDFYATFGLGKDAQHIAPSDLAGLALAGVQGLLEIIQLQGEQIAVLASAYGIDVALPNAGSLAAIQAEPGGGGEAAPSATDGSTADDGSSATAPRQLPTTYALVPSGPAVVDGNGYTIPPGYTLVQLPAGWSGGVVDGSAGGSDVQSAPDDAAAASSSTLASDVFINDDLIVDGSMAIGFDTVNGESFGFDTLRLKENNLRIHFDDTSNSGSFPRNDWRIVINDTTNGGAEYFGIEDATAGRIPFRVLAGAPTNSIRVDSQGDVGFGTDNPAVELHVANGDSPSLRLEQNGSSGWTPQTWDIVGNETNFFLRDATNGSKLPFRIQPGAPTSSIDIEGTSGDVGLGTANASASLHVKRSNGTAKALIEETNETVDQIPDVMLELRNSDDVRIVLNNTDPSNAQEWNIETVGGNDFRINRSGSGRQEALFSDDGRVQFNIVSGSGTFDLDTSGNLTIAGNITTGSSAAIKENFAAPNAGRVLAGLADLPILEWNYIADDDSIRHAGPTAEDFFARFSLGADAQHIAPSDMAGVALVGLQALVDAVENQNEVLAAISAAAGVEFVSAIDAVKQAAAEAPTHEAPAETAGDEGDSQDAPPADEASSTVLGGQTLLGSSHGPGPEVTVDPASVLTTNEGGTVTLDLNIEDTVNDAFDVNINWGDDSSTDVRFEGNGREVEQFTVFTHTYEDDNPTVTSSDPYTITINVTNLSTLETTQLTTTATVDNVPPLLANLQATALDGNNFATVSGSIFDPAGQLETFSLDINWGDGSSNTVVSASQFSPSFSAAHQFSGTGPFTVTIDVTDDDSGTSQSTLTVSEQATILTDVRIESTFGVTIDEGQSVELNAEIVGTGSYTVEIDANGDGTFDQTLTNVPAGSFGTTLNYLDDDPTGTSSDTYDVLVRLTDPSSGIVNESTVQVTVNNVAPSVDTITATPLDGNSQSTIDIEFQDPAGATFGGSIDDTFDITFQWGDGTADTVLLNQTIPPTQSQQSPFTIARRLSQSHTFQGTGPFTVAVTITDDDGGSTSTTVTVADPGLKDVLVSGATSTTIDEGDTVELTGIIGGNGPFTLDIDWDGDGNSDETVTQNDAGPFSITHVYPDDVPTGTSSDTYTVSVDLSGGETDSAEVQVTVDNVDPDVRNIDATQIDSNGDATLFFEILDPGAGEVFDITIDWGHLDGNDDPVIQVLTGQTATTYAILHTFPSATVEFVPIVTVTDDDGGQDTDTTVIEPANPALLSDLRINDDPVRATVDEGETVLLTGILSAAGTVEIDWDGDNMVDETVAGLPAGTFSIPHLYADDDSPVGNSLYTVSALFTADSGGDSLATVQARVLNVEPRITQVSVNAVLVADADGSIATVVVNEGETVTVDGTLVDPGLLDTHSVTIFWGDGSFSTVGVTLPNPGTGGTGDDPPGGNPDDDGERVFTASHVYTVTADTTFTIQIDVADDNGGEDGVSADILVLNVNNPPGTPLDVDNDDNEVFEGAANGTTVGVTAQAIDPDGDTVTYSLTDNAGGRFAINSSSGVVTVADGSLLDGPDSHTITVQAQDPLGETSSADFTIDVLNVDPTIDSITVSAPSINEGQSVTVSGTFSDPAMGTNPSQGVDVGLDPNDYSSLGIFFPVADVSIDTTTLAMIGGFAGSGVIETVAGLDGPVEIAVFTFDSIFVGAGITVTATGSRPVALLSHDGAIIDGVIDVSAVRFDRADSEPGAGGGAGGELSDGSPFDGFPAFGAPADSVGTMGGFFLQGGGGAGAAFGGDGGTGSVQGQPSGTAGLAYGDLQTVIQGGSGGGGARRLTAGQLPSGGSGGGGIEIGAVNSIVIGATGSVLADAAHGGGGSLGTAGGGGGAGGGILLHAFAVASAGTLSADGGNGGFASQGGGGGGGGRILVAHNVSGGFVNNGTHSVAGGLKASGAAAQNGQDGTFDVISAAGSGGSTETFTGTAVWSDGVATTLTVDGDTGTFTTTRAFPDDHPATGTPSDDFTVVITINDDNGGTDSATSPVVTVNNVDPQIMLIRTSELEIDEGDSVTVSGEFSDPGTGPTETFTGTAVWSDGVSTTLTVNADRTFETTRTFDDDHPASGTPADTFDITITINDDDLGSVSVTSTVVTVENVAPSIDAINVSAASITEGDAVTVSGSFSDPGTGATETFTGTALWSDGVSTPLTINPDRTFETTRAFLDDHPATGTAFDPFTVAITINDDDLGSFSVTSTVVTVENVDPTIDAINVSAASISEGDAVTVSGSFSDPGTGPTETFTGTAVWSDGATTPLTINPDRTFETTRSFPDDDPTGTPFDTFTVAITIDDDDLGSDTATSQVIIVNNVAPTLTLDPGSGSTLANKGTVDDPVTVSGSFADVGVLDTHTVTVDWGDGSPLETLTSVDQVNDVFDGDHTYSTGGIFTITVTVIDDDTGIASQTTSAVVTGVGIVDGTLYVIGTDVKDKVEVKGGTDGGIDVVKVKLDIDGGSDGDVDVEFPLADVDDIVIHLCAGNDEAKIDKNVEIDAEIYGGDGEDDIDGGGGDDLIFGDAGDDKLDGGRGSDILFGGDGDDEIKGGTDGGTDGPYDDILVGGDGDDKLEAGKGMDILIGGLGEDEAKGDGDGDLLVGGFTIYDNDVAVLDQIRQTWTSGADYDDDVDALTDPGGLLEVGVTVFGDGVKDKLEGKDDAHDLFFAELGLDELKGEDGDDVIPLP